METLPLETLENICRYLVPPDEARKYRPQRSRNYFEARQEPFRADCLAIRRTCKTLSYLRTPAAALFYDFNVFVTPQSLDRLELLSQHPFLRNYVHRLVFCSPMLQPKLGDPRQYRTRIRSEKWRLVQSIYSHVEEETGLVTYQAALAEQTNLLRGVAYTEICARCLSRFPLLSSIFISDGVPRAINLDMNHHFQIRTMFQRKYPKVLLRNMVEGIETESPDLHVANVLEAVAIAKIPLEELVTYNGWGPSNFFSMDHVRGWPVGLDVSKLTRLDLCLRDSNEPYEPTDLQWSTTIGQLSLLMPAVTELHLRFVCKRWDHPTMNKLWDLNIPHLTKLGLEGLTMSRTGFVRFMDRHRHLREITLNDVRVNNERWLPVFRALREHPALEDLEISNVDNDRLSSVLSSDRLSSAISTLDVPRPIDDGRLELYNYLHRKGDWTDKLEVEWRRHDPYYP
ncbi:hypothetical protein A1O3_06046 [Capronia epimyces CBS 606.96]|uniref:Uncharacterized protein n=1 Tax=Capronia epimyces CBS 606.96 TaxID=1182542 RepID=W9XPS8_9EURO|nr:uncharacterized protein A1O3_06046 [Capronia epimyces CBS 606.96]EXJ82233.1 hypothetical protein A1O3_06046 [Capronia epimyces CBS 606.96]